MLFCSRFCTRGCCGVPSELPHETDLRVQRDGRRLCQIFILSGCRSTSRALAWYNICPGCLFPDYSRDPAGANFGAFNGYAYLLEMYDKTTSNTDIGREYFIPKSL